MFANATAEAYPSKKKIYIVYDGKVLSAPNVQAEITDGKAVISGSFDTYESAEELASMIRIGALPVELKEIQSQVDLPIIGIVKRDYDDSKIYITPTMKEIDELMEVKPEIIAMDATISTRPGNKTLDEFFHEVKEKYPDQLFMADCSTVEEALHADELGFDFIGTTMVGYTEQSKGDKIEANDFEILRKILASAKHKVIAEGNINTPEKARRVIELGAYSVVVGSIITRPQLITKSFVEEMER